MVTNIVEAVSLRCFQKTGLAVEFYLCFATSGALFNSMSNNEIQVVEKVLLSTQ
jgi:hypothetical protein